MQSSSSSTEHQDPQDRLLRVVPPVSDSPFSDYYVLLSGGVDLIFSLYD